MDLALAILLWILIVVGSLLLLLLLVPLHARAEGEIHDLDAKGRVVLGWGWFVVRVRLSSETGADLRLFGLRVWRFRPGEQRRPEPKPEAEPARVPEKTRKGGGKGIRWFLKTRPLLMEIMRKAMRTLHLRGRIRGTLGTGDPMDTALVRAAAETVAARFERLDVDIHWDWVDETLELEGRVRTIVWPLEMAVVAVMLLVRRDVRQAMRAEA